MGALALLAASLCVLLLWPRSAGGVNLGMPGTASVAAQDLPSRPDNPLPVTFTTRDPRKESPQFTLQLPFAPEGVASAVASKGATALGSAVLGTRAERLVLLDFGTTQGSARDSLLKERSDVLVPSDEMRLTRVGDVPALAQDFSLGSAAVFGVREFRFVRGGRLFSAGIIYRYDDEQALSTGLAALQTLRWV